jgi:hypothetical protein
MKEIKEDQDVAKSTLRLPADEMRELKVFCAQHDITMKEFLRHAVQYCVKNKILPGKGK